MKKKKTGSTATYFPVRTDDVHLPSPKARFALPWPSIPVIIPHRLRRKLRSRLRSRQSPASSLASLQTSLSPVDTLKSLRAHRWTVYDAQYVLLAVLAIFSLCVIASPGPLVKTGLAALITASLLLPITRQFFLPFLPIASWLILFYACRSVLPFPIALMSFADPIVGRAQVPSDGLPWPREIAQVSWRTMSKIMLTIGNSFISGEYRPPIWVRVLPALENIFYGANLSNILSAHQHVFLDVLAWLPYGIIHFGAPFVCSAIMFIFAPPGTLPVFAKSFGYMNLAGVTIQLLFPCSPPWYENMYGLAPANYSMEGSPAGLARVDQLFGIDLYTSSFTASPLVFGAFPSLHAGCATTEALFMSHVFPQLRPFFIGYTLWIWWATMYLSHHYAVDLIGGSLLAGVVFYVAKAKFLPRVQHDKETRWDYDYVEVGDVPSGYSYGLAEMGAEFSNHAVLEGDEWTVGSSSSFSSGSLSPVDESQSIWEGETLASHSDNDAGVVIKGFRR